MFKYRGAFSASIEGIVDKVKEETGVEKEVIYKVVAAQFGMVRDVIANSDDKKGSKNLKFENFKSVRLIYLGAFMPSKSKFNKVKKALIKREKDV